MSDHRPAPSLAARLTSRTGILAVSIFLSFAGFTLIIPVLPFSVARYVAGADVALWVSIILAAYALCTFVAAPMLGALSDRYGRRPVLLLSLLGSSLGFAVFGIGGALWVLVLGRVLEGLTAGNISTVYASVADMHAPQDRGVAFGTLGAAGGLGFMLGPVLGGVLGQVSLAAPLYAAAVLALLNAAWVYLRLPESLPVERRNASLQWNQLSVFNQLTAALRDTRLRVLFTIVFCFAAATTLLASNLAVLLRDILAFKPVSIGMVLFGIGVMDIISQGIVSPRLLRRFGECRVAVAGLTINGIGFLVIAALTRHPALPLLVIGIASYAFGDGLFQPSAGAMISGAAPDDRQGQVQGANQAQQSIARVIAPLAGAGLYALQAWAPYVAGAMIVTLAAVGLKAGNRTRGSRPNA